MSVYVLVNGAMWSSVAVPGGQVAVCCGHQLSTCGRDGQQCVVSLALSVDKNAFTACGDDKNAATTSSVCVVSRVEGSSMTYCTDTWRCITRC